MGRAHRHRRRLDDADVDAVDVVLRNEAVADLGLSSSAAFSCSASDASRATSVALVDS
jgi:hypothetical protein